MGVTENDISKQKVGEFYTISKHLPTTKITVQNMDELDNENNSIYINQNFNFETMMELQHLKYYRYNPVSRL